MIEIKRKNNAKAEKKKRDERRGEWKRTEKRMEKNERKKEIYPRTIYVEMTRCFAPQPRRLRGLGSHRVHGGKSCVIEQEITPDDFE